MVEHIGTPDGRDRCGRRRILTGGVGAVPPGRTWVHVSTLLGWNRPPVGIVRVEQEYCRWLLGQPQAVTGELRFCRFDKGSRRFVEVAAHSVAACLPKGDTNAVTDDASTSHAGVRSVLRRLLPYIPERWVPTLHRFAHWTFRQLRFQRVRRVGQASLRRLRARLRPPVEAQFQAGDRWVSLGLDWDTLDQKALYQTKIRHDLHITLMCYDVIPALFPQLVVLAPGNFAAYIVDAAWCADQFLCISKHTQQDLQALLSRLGAPVKQSHVVHLGADVAVGARASRPAGLGEDPDSRPFVLYVSTIERRKNHELLYRSWLRLRERGLTPHRLVFVGMPGWGVTDLMNDLRLDPRIRDDIVILERVQDAELAWLYQNCAFSVFPSLYEGWGLPVAESLAWGKFCLASGAASLPEAGGAWAEYLDPWDVPRWVERLAYYMTDPHAVTEREQCIANGYVAPRWADTAAAIHRYVIQAGRVEPVAS